MPRCPACGGVCSADARFCPSCGSTVAGQPPMAPAPPDRRLPRGASEWLSLDDVIYTRDRRLGAIGAPLVLLGACLPWANVASWWGKSVGISSPLAWLVGLAGIAAGLLLFRPRMGVPVLVIGIAVAGLSLISVLSMSDQNASPSIGVVAALAGGVLLAVSGYMTNEYDKRSG